MMKMVVVVLIMFIWIMMMAENAKERKIRFEMLLMSAR
jgi:hypothetical protein